MDMKPLWRWLRGDVPPANPADQAVARQAYADYLRAQIIGFAPATADDLLALLTTETIDGVARNTASFAELMGVETRLVGALSDDLVDRTYWIVRERFGRVGSARAIGEHNRWSPPSLADPGEASAAAAPAPVPAPPPPDTDEDPAVDSAALDQAAADREATVRHEQALDIAAADPPDDEAGADAVDATGDAPPPPPAPAQPRPLPEDE